MITEVKFINPMELDSAAKKVRMSNLVLAHPASGSVYCSLVWRRLLFSHQKSSIFATFLRVLPRKKWWCWVCPLAVSSTSCCYAQKTKHSLKWLMPQILLLCLRIMQQYLLQLGRSIGLLFDKVVVAKTPFTCTRVIMCVLYMYIHITGTKMCLCNTQSIKN